MRLLNRFALFIGCTVGLAVSLQAADEAHPKFDGDKLIPTKMCAMCHAKDDVGNQVAKLKESSHAKAFESLKSDAAKEVAKKLGVDDPTTSGKCLKCHSTAYGFTEERVSTKVSVEEGITCQSCHGPGKDYAAKHKKDLDKAYAELGLLKATEANTCSRCHNPENPTHNPERYTKADGTKADFDFEQAAKKIEHPKPAK